MNIKPLEWTEPQKANESISYDHVTAITPFGRFLITWKGWKENDSPTIDETPWGDWGGVEDNVDAAKALAEQEYYKRINECLDL